MAALRWDIEGADWPHRRASRFVEAGGLTWHVQVMGEGPVLLLLHGTGAATHSWRDVAPILAQTHTVVALDLPGHGFTQAPIRADQYTLPRVAAAVQALMTTLRLTPHAIIGHSAGAAIAVRMALDGAGDTRVVGLNPALLPFPGPLGPLAPWMARGLFYNPFAISAFAMRARQPGAVQRLIEGTGSHLDPKGLELYARLFSSTEHLAATIGLMAHWDLAALRHDMAGLRAPLTLIVAENDRAVPADQSRHVAQIVPHAQIMRAPRLGHLAHEEAPSEIAAQIARALSG